jgi:2-amino-4-hydroxy-6-hydroxymethyldihydropteridine diphosphokinase
MALAFISLGSNIGNKIMNFTIALERMRARHIQIENCSRIYQTAAWGNTNQDDFLNAVVQVSTELKPHDLLTTLLDIEAGMGRQRGDLPWQPRTIDLDILYYDDTVINDEILQIPHPHLHQRRFTLIPLNDLDADFIHPVLKQSNKELLLHCSDKCEVHATKSVLVTND